MAIGSNARLAADNAETPVSPAFRAALLAVVPDLRAFGRALSGDATIADDLVQETLMRAWAAHAGFDPASSIRAWTFTILRNAHYSRWRKMARETHWDPDLDHRLATGAGQEPGIDLADLYRALHRLPLLQREALMLVGAGGWTYEEAAAICGCQPGTIKSRVSRARAALMADSAISRSTPARPSAERAYDGILAEISQGVARWQGMMAGMAGDNDSGMSLSR